MASCHNFRDQWTAFSWRIRETERLTFSLFIKTNALITQSHENIQLNSFKVRNDRINSPKREYHIISHVIISQVNVWLVVVTHTTFGLKESWGGNEVEWTGKPNFRRQKFLAAGEEFKARFRPAETESLKGNTLGISEIYRMNLKFCFRGTPKLCPIRSCRSEGRRVLI